ncbi:protein HIRA/HIR1, partial [Lecanoromycetidae sp. Uapishka_2]
MRYIRPVWLTHSGEKKDFEVYSCHVSPDGTRLVTAAGDGFVRVWSTEAIYNAADPNFTKPRQLASMCYHSGTIHSVRFAGNGQYLASGADDKIVCIYKYDPNPPSQSSVFGSNELPPVESWKIFRRLIGHDNDVQDLGWSYDSSILVSVGLDSKVVVWSGHTFEKLKTLVGHQSHVKGLTFDPANKYFGTASDDRTIKIWRFTSPGPNSSAHDQMNNFTLERTITTPFVTSPLTTYFRRCSWSPDGNHIAAANAVNGPVSSIAIINRGTWDGDINLIGHEAPVEVCAFSPRLFTSSDPSKVRFDAKTTPVHTVIACAGQDKVLSVWITSNPRPLVIAQDMAVKSISDLAWTPDGKTLFLSTLDGTVIAVIFETSEVGYETALDENERALAKFGAGRRGAGIVEGTDGLLLEEKSKQGEMRGVEGRMGALMGDAMANTPTLTNGNDHVQPPAALTNGANGPSALPNGQANEPDAPKSDAEVPKDPNAAKLERLKNRVTITKDGKKRIAPLLVSSAGNESSLPRPQLMASTNAGQPGQNDQPQAILDLSKPFDGLPKGGLSALLLGNKRRLAQLEGVEDDHIDKKIALASQDGAIPILSNSVNGLVPAKTVSAPEGQQRTPDFIRPAVTNPSMTVGQVRLAVPKIRSHIVRTFGESGATDGNSTNGYRATTNQSNQTEIMIEARNPTHVSATGRAQDQEPCRIVVTKRGQPVFQDFLPRSALLVSGNTDFWTVACEDGSIYAWTPAGRRLLNALVLESQPVILDCQDQWLLCVTAAGLCYVWNMKSLSSPHPPVSLAPILDIAVHSLQDHPTRAPAITGARLNSEGRIVITLTNGEGYAYSPTMYVWQRLSELWWMVGSQYWNSLDSSVGNLRSTSALGNGTSSSNVSAGVIPFLERTTTNEVLARGRAQFLSRLVKQLLSREGFEGFESGVSIAHLENRIAAAMMLGAKDEFQVYLYMYAKRLGAEGLKLKVEELLRGLLGGIFEDSEDQDEAELRKQKTAEDRHFGNKSETLCKNRDLQRITVPYAKVLGVMDEQGGVPMVKKHAPNPVHWLEQNSNNSLEYLGAIGVGKGWMISYRHMCRWNSGFFYKHPRLKEFDWYWRVEPDVHFFCDIDYDVFRFMRDNSMKYGFNMNILDDARSFPSLWSRTRSFINAHPELIHPDADLDWLLDAHNSGDYNNCQFFSNFEIGDLNFFRGQANEKYFDWLDRGGGFYYERFGDAPIHTLSVAMFVPKSEIWFFRDIGYQHDINRHCPPSSSNRCSCDPTSIDENFYRLVPLESPQKKPDDTCIRQFLGGHWLEKKQDWSQEAERAFGGDGYHGYKLGGLEEL